jgi:hypothetical protein
MMIDRTDAAERLARIEQLIWEYRAKKRRQLLRRARKLWLAAEAHQRLARFEAPPERVN